MRSYWMSLSVVAGLLLGYTALVFNSHSATTPSQQQTTKNSSEPREPAAANTQAATIEAASSIN